MASPSRAPWSFDRSWGDPMLVTLLILGFLLASMVLGRRAAPTPPSNKVSLAARLAEPGLLAPERLRWKGQSLLKPTNWERAWKRYAEPWDRALIAIWAQEQGVSSELLRDRSALPPVVDRALRQIRERGPALSSEDQAELRRGLEATVAGQVLESRWVDLAGGAGRIERERALAQLSRRCWIQAGLGLVLGAVGLGGAGFALFLALRKGNASLRSLGIEGRPLALVVLAWFCTLLVSGSVVGLLIHPLPQVWRMLGLPLAYGLHAGFAIWLIQGFSGESLGLWFGAPPRLPWKRVLAWALGFAGLAVASVFVVGLLTAPLLSRGQPPQKELLETLAAVRGVPAVTLMFLTVAVLAPAFEEVLFRGVLLPWLAAKWGRGWALLGTSLLFGAIHLVPRGLPTLATLGVVLGFAFYRTGDLRVCILVHGAWNGAVFLFMRWNLS